MVLNSLWCKTKRSARLTRLHKREWVWHRWLDLFFIATDGWIGNCDFRCMRNVVSIHHIQTNSSNLLAMKTQRVIIVVLSLLVVVLAYLAFSTRNKPEGTPQANTAAEMWRTNTLENWRTN